jgi:hypothetical protein
MIAGARRGGALPPPAHSHRREPAERLPYEIALLLHHLVLGGVTVIPPGSAGVSPAQT